MNPKDRMKTRADRRGQTWERVWARSSDLFLVVGSKEDHLETGPADTLLDLETGEAIHRFTHVLDDADERCETPHLEHWRRLL